MFRKILVANRGEIALRVIRAARELGCKTATVYSNVDSNSLHVRYADEAYPVGGPRSYLNMEKLIDIALKAKCDAIHPGYGFLAENPVFAEKCLSSGLTFIGPNPKCMRMLGDKVYARSLAEREGIPVTPGTNKLKSVSDALREAEKIGYPVAIKAAGGGGGIGIRIARNPMELENYFELSLNEALNAFDSPDLYLEKFLESPKHIEVQILSDNYGNIVSLHERECSIQRRFQKIMEEAPSPAINDEKRGIVEEYAVRLAERVGYTNIGTVEFLMDKNGDFHFLESNPRIQVEHTVTEMVTGIDIVKQQILIAADEEIPFKQGDVGLNGHAMEARVYAEDAENGFKPCPGTIKSYIAPAGNVRVESAIYPGCEVTPYYEPLLLKVIAWGRDRGECLARMRNALNECRITGVETNLPLLKQILHHDFFIRGEANVTFVDELIHLTEKLEREEELIPILAVAVDSYFNKRANIENKTRRIRRPNWGISEFIQFQGFLSSVWRRNRRNGRRNT